MQRFVMVLNAIEIAEGISGRHLFSYEHALSRSCRDIIITIISIYSNTNNKKDSLLFILLLIYIYSN